MSIFKVEAQGDTLYIEAETSEEAKDRLFDVMGHIPGRLLRWTEVEELPEGEEFL